jgi:hypothetical protein
MALFRPSGIQYTDGTLTDAQIKTMTSTPIVLVTSTLVGTDHRAKPVALSFQYSFVTATYTNINTCYAALQVGWDNMTGPWAMTPIVDDVSSTAWVLAKFSSMFGGSVHDGMVDMAAPYLQIAPVWWVPQPGVRNSWGSVVSKNLALSIDNNGSGALTGGSTNNFVHYRFWYAIEYTV